MPFFSFLRRLFGWPTLDLRTDSAGVDTSVEVVESPGPDPELDACAEDAWWIPRGGDPVLEGPKPVKTTIGAGTHERITQALDDPKLELPQLPRVTQQALMSLRSDKLDYAVLAETVTQDPVLTAEILRVANSVAFRRLTEVQGLEPAFSRLGVRELRRILLATSMKSVMLETGPRNRNLGRGLWQCSRVSAALMEHVAPRVNIDPGQAYLIGLLHDIGKVAVLRVMHGMLAGHALGVPRDDFDRVCENWHEHLGMRLATTWDLPDPLPEVIGSHHHPPAADHPLRRHRLLVTLVDVVCSMLNYSPYVPYDFFNLECVRELDIVDDAETREWLLTWPALAASQARVD